MTTPDPNPRLTLKEIAEQAHIIAEVVEGGYTLEQADVQFCGSFHPEDWATIRSTALAQAPKKGSVLEINSLIRFRWLSAMSVG